MACQGPNPDPGEIGFMQCDLKVFRAPCRLSGATAKATVWARQREFCLCSKARRCMVEKDLWAPM